MTKQQYYYSKCKVDLAYILNQLAILLGFVALVLGQ